MARLQITSTTLSNLRRRSVAVCRRALPALAAGCLLGACSIQGSDILSIYRIARYAISGESKTVTLQRAASVPYASMGVRLGNGREAMLILAGDTPGGQLWTSASHIAITTHNGRIIRTAGFEHDLGGYESRNTSPGKDGGQTLRWQADFPDLKLYSVPIVCQERQTGAETIVILGKDIQVRRVDESCASEGGALDWSFKNRYWIDPANGLVWRSIQHVHPQLDAIETEILRPPG